MATDFKKHTKSHMPSPIVGSTIWIDKNVPTHAPSPLWFPTIRIDKKCVSFKMCESLLGLCGWEKRLSPSSQPVHVWKRSNTCGWLCCICGAATGFSHIAQLNSCICGTANGVSHIAQFKGCICGTAIGVSHIA